MPSSAGDDDKLRNLGRVQEGSEGLEEDQWADSVGGEIRLKSFGGCGKDGLNARMGSCRSASTNEERGILTSVGNDDINLPILLLDELSGSRIVVLVSGADLNELDSVTLFRNESSKSVVRIEIDVSYSRKDDVVGV